MRKTLGILGGMGPLVSAEFLKSIYACRNDAVEQDAPDVVMFSLPSAPDRTRALLGDGLGQLLDFLNLHLERLGRLSDKIVIPCFTAHVCLPQLRGHLVGKIISLLELADHELTEHPGPALLLATEGSYRSRLFDRCLMSSNLVHLAPEDQAECSRLIYRVLKQGADPLEALPVLQGWARSYGTPRLLAGCTEFHLVARALPQDSGIQLLDPLGRLAQRLDCYLNRPALCYC